MADDNRPADTEDATVKDKAPPQPPPAVTKLAFAALGVVFGDIGTNPLYAIRLIFHDTPDFAHDPRAITGVLSLIIWSVILMVCVKYVTFVMRADHDGEGGTLALLGLLHTRDKPNPYATPAALTLLVLFGSGLLYGDGMVTPAISVLSAVEGLAVATSAFKPYVVPLAAIILLALFLIQSHGTETIGRAFGPIMLVWFVTIGILGAISIVHHPSVLVAFDPRLGLEFLFGRGGAGYATLGSVVLAFSGVEALFADLGHFGRRAITLAWYIVVLPGLMLNYLGQGALVLGDANAGAEPFFGLVPHWRFCPSWGCRRWRRSSRARP
jgi:KUP system potassium uptake protein